MKKQEKSEDVFVSPQPGPDIAAFMIRIEQKLSFIEKKMDTLIAQTPARPFEARPSSFPVPQHRSQDVRHNQRQHFARPSETKAPSVPVPPPVSQSRPMEAPQVPAQSSGHGHSRERREKVLHKAVCAECQKDCEIPFKPTGERPVYCKECFSKRKSNPSSKEPAVERPEPVLSGEVSEAPAPSATERKVTVTKKGVGKVTVSEIARPNAREASHKGRPAAPEKKSKG